MKIVKTLEGSCLTLNLEGRLDTSTAPELETLLETSLNGVDTLILDLEALAYLSSAGLRVLLKAQKLMNGKGTMTVKNVNDSIMEVFEITGFTDILTII